MIRHATTVSELRFFDDAGAGPMAAYDASCILIWEAPHVVWIRMLRGKLSRRLLRELVAWLAQSGIDLVKSHRADGHVLPFGERQEDGSYIVRVACLVDRFTQPGASGFAAL